MSIYCTIFHADSVVLALVFACFQHNVNSICSEREKPSWMGVMRKEHQLHARAYAEKNQTILIDNAHHDRERAVSGLRIRDTCYG